MPPDTTPFIVTFTATPKNIPIFVVALHVQQRIAPPICAKFHRRAATPIEFIVDVYLIIEITGSNNLSNYQKEGGPVNKKKTYNLSAHFSPVRTTSSYSKSKKLKVNFISLVARSVSTYHWQKRLRGYWDGKLGDDNVKKE
uniref:Uncharacterized protein n=1 Tax=Romanomermis culicivorax TaxID=13658 RepID=A0A915J3W9_ROMCU